MHIALDFDRTLAEYYGGKTGIMNVGRPIEPMVKQVKKWLGAGHQVTIFTARVAPTGKNGTNRDSQFIALQVMLIEGFLKSCGLPKLPITATKYPHFDFFVDDKAVPVLENEGLFPYKTI